MWILSRILGLLAAKEVRSSLRRARRSALALGAAGLFALTGYLFLLAALALWLAEPLGPAGAALVVGVGLFALSGGIMAGLAHVRRREERERRLRRIDRTEQAALMAGGLAAVRSLTSSKWLLALLGAAAVGFMLMSRKGDGDPADDA